MGLNLSGNILTNASIGSKGEVLKTISNSMTLYLDTTNISSYNGSSNYWYDLSGNNNHAQMYGTVPYTTDVISCWNFATVSGTYSGDANMGFTFGSNMVPNTGNFSLSFWIKNPNNSSGQVGMFSNAGGADGYRFGIGTNGIYYLIGPTYQEGGISFLSTLSSSLWYNVTCVYNRTGTSILLYLNGVIQNSTSIPSQGTSQNGAPGIVRSPCCGLYTGKLAISQVYNYTLSSTDVLNIFTSQKSRFGL
jgi:hypothetical protein